MIFVILCHGNLIVINFNNRSCSRIIISAVLIQVLNNFICVKSFE